MDTVFFFRRTRLSVIITALYPRYTNRLRGIGNHCKNYENENVGSEPVDFTVRLSSDVLCVLYQTPRARTTQKVPFRRAFEPSLFHTATVLNPILSGYIHVYQSHTVTHIFYVHTHFNGRQYVKVRTLPRVGMK